MTPSAAARPLLLAALGLLVLAAVDSGCARSGFDPEAAIPADASMLLRLQMNEIAGSESEWSRMITDRVEADPSYAEFKTASGLDPIRDVQELVVAQGPDARSGQWVAVLHGAFTEAKVVEALKKREGYAEKTVSGTTMHTVPATTGPSIGTFFPAEGWAVAVAEPWQPEVLDTIGGRAQSVAANETLQGLLDNLNRQDTLWMAWELPEELLAQLRPGPGKAPPNPLMGTLAEGKPRSLVLSMDAPDATPGSPMQLRLLVRSEDPDSASKLHGMAGGALNLGKMLVASRSPTAMELMGQIQLGVEGNVVSADLAFDPAMLETMQEEFESAASKAGPGPGPDSAGR